MFQGGDKALITHLNLLSSSFPVLPPDLKWVTTAWRRSASELQKSDFESKCLIHTLKPKAAVSIKNVLYCDMSGKKKITEVHCKRRQKKEETFSLMTLNGSDQVQRPRTPQSHSDDLWPLFMYHITHTKKKNIGVKIRIMCCLYVK